MAGAIEFERALAVLIIVPEFFLPLRPAGDALPQRCGGPDRRRPGCSRSSTSRCRWRPAGPRRGREPVPAEAPIRLAGVTVTYPGPHRAGHPRAGPDDPRARAGRARRGDRGGQVDDRQRPAPVRGARRRRGAGRRPAAVRHRPCGLAAACRLGPAAAAPVPRHDRRHDPARAARRRRRGRPAGGPRGGRRGVHRRAAARLLDSRSARTGSGSAAGSGSGSRSPGPSSPTRGWSSSTRRPRSSTRPASGRSATRSGGSPAIAPSSSSRTGCGWCPSPTWWRSSTGAGWSRPAPRPSWPSATAPTAGCWRPPTPTRMRPGRAGADA